MAETEDMNHIENIGDVLNTSFEKDADSAAIHLFNRDSLHSN